MKRLMITSGIACFLFLFACQNTLQKAAADTEPKDQPQEISFQTTDSIKIFGDLYVSDKNAPIILLFHQGGANARSEYGPIIPRLLEKGYNILATDQRRGGQYFGNYNRTLANVPTYSYGDPYTYCDAYSNLEAALDYVLSNGFTGKKLLWGSSYSATLAIILAHERNQDVDAVLAFSPAAGEPMEGCNPGPYIEKLTVPLLLMRPAREMQSENAQRHMELAKKQNHQTYIAEHGVHGSSMLVESRTKHPMEEAWQVVTGFLEETAGN